MGLHGQLQGWLCPFLPFYLGQLHIFFVINCTNLNGNRLILAASKIWHVRQNITIQDGDYGIVQYISCINMKISRRQQLKQEVLGRTYRLLYFDKTWTT
jgi:hypothetical protein